MKAHPLVEDRLNRYHTWISGFGKLGRNIYTLFVEILPIQHHYFLFSGIFFVDLLVKLGLGSDSCKKAYG